MIAIIDYGMGNLRSVQKAFEKVGAQAHITHNADEILKADKIVLPGVGAMPPAIARLEELHLIDAIKKVITAKKPFLGICLGLQLLFEKSSEGGNTKGLGILKGTVERFTSLKVPHMGWNQLSITDTMCPLLKNIDDNGFVYFCHSYFVKPQENNVTVTKTDYGIDFTSTVCQNNVFGVQFHPEKSQTAGLQILKNFKDL